MGDDKKSGRQSLTKKIYISGAVCLVLIVTLSLTAAKCENEPETTASTAGTTTLQTQNFEQDAFTAMGGYGLLPKSENGTVDPEQAVTRAEFANLVINALAWEGQLAGHPSFADVTPDHPYYRAVEKAKALFDGYTPTAEPGKDEPLPTFNPEGTLTRSEAVRILSAALDLEPTGQALAATIQLPADDPITKESSLPLLWKDAARLFYLAISSRLPEPSGTFAISGIN